MGSVADFQRAVLIMGSTHLPRWEQIALLVREYAAALETTDRDWLAKTQAYLDRLTAAETDRPLDV